MSLTDGYEVIDLPRPILCAESAKGAAQIAAIKRSADSCAFSTSPTKEEATNASVPPRPPGRITMSYVS